MRITRLVCLTVAGSLALYVKRSHYHRVIYEQRAANWLYFFTKTPPTPTPSPANNQLAIRLSTKQEHHAFDVSIKREPIRWPLALVANGRFVGDYCFALRWLHKRFASNVHISRNGILPPERTIRFIAFRKQFVGGTMHPAVCNIMKLIRPVCSLARVTGNWFVFVSLTATRIDGSCGSNGLWYERLKGIKRWIPLVDSTGTHNTWTFAQRNSKGERITQEEGKNTAARTSEKIQINNTRVCNELSAWLSRTVRTAELHRTYGRM